MASSSEQPKRIGLVGLSAGGSWASRSHLHYLLNTPHYKITALQNSSKASAEAAAKAYGLEGVATYGDPASLAQDPNVDIVAVSVNVPQHYDLVKPAIEAGKDIFVEWPLARNLAEAEELNELAKKKGVRTLVGLQARHSPAIRKAREIVQSGKLGRILASHMYGHGLILGPVVPKSFLYGLPVEAGANLVAIPFGHAVDALCYVLGEFESLTATLANNRKELTVVDEKGKEVGKASKTAHDYASVTGVLANGGGVVDVTYAPGESRTGKDFYWEINGTEGSLVFEGPKGHIQMFEPTLKLVLGDGDKKTVEQIELEKKGDYAKGDYAKGDFSGNVGSAWDAFAGVELDKGASVTSFEDAVLRHKLIDAVYKSAEKGTRERYI